MVRVVELAAALHPQRLAPMRVVAVVDWVLLPVVWDRLWVGMVARIPLYALRAVAVERMRPASSQHAQKAGVNVLYSVAAVNLAVVVDVQRVVQVVLHSMALVRPVQPAVLAAGSWFC